MKQNWRPGTMIYPLPAIMVSCGGNDEEMNIFTASWVGTICSDPAMLSISVRKERFSYNMILNSGGEKIVVGMPIALLKEFDGTRVLGVLLELTLKRDNGNSQRYHLFAARPDTEWYGTNVGYFWVEGGKITSISYNQ